METTRIKWNEAKWQTQTLEGQWWCEDTPNPVRRKSVNVQERLADVGNQSKISKFSPTIADEYPN